MKLDGMVLIIDDNRQAAKGTIAAIQNYVPEKQIQYAQNGAEAMNVLREHRVSLVFLDIDMPDTSGFAIASWMDVHYKGVPYVFLTGYADFALQSYEYEPLDFLTKPIDVIRLQKTFDRLEAREEVAMPGKVAVQTAQGFALLEPQSILYIARVGRRNHIYCEKGQEYIVGHTMDELEVILGDYGFFRNHQSYLIPFDKIVRVSATEFGKTYEAVLIDGTVIPVSRAKYPLLREILVRRGVRFV